MWDWIWYLWLAHFLFNDVVLLFQNIFINFDMQSVIKYLVWSMNMLGCILEYDDI